MKTGYKICTARFNFQANTHSKDFHEPGKVEYSHNYFLEIEKEAAKAHIQDVIEKSEADEVLKYKQKGLFSQLGDFIKSHMHKIKK